MATYKTQSMATHTPKISEVANVLQKGLESTFKEVEVSIVACPNLSEAPFNLAAPGLGGSPRVSEVGGVPFLMPHVQLDKIYDFTKIAKALDLPEAFILGAGAGPLSYVGVNSEMMPNVYIGKNTNNCSKVVKFVPETNSYELMSVPPNEMTCSLLQNLYACEGKPGNVIKVKAKFRKGEDNFVSCMRKALDNHYKEQVVAMGGSFLMLKGSAKCHVMPKFSETTLKSDADVNNWLKFFNMPSPMVFLSVFVSRDPGLDFRIEHTHGFGENCGGHYHCDVTPDEVEYEGYFNVAEHIYRVDRPPFTHSFGRD